MDTFLTELRGLLRHGMWVVEGGGPRMSPECSLSRVGHPGSDCQPGGNGDMASSRSDRRSSRPGPPPPLQQMEGSLLGWAGT
jgi:hypothetical protein